jgi:hypothetical protein
MGLLTECISICDFTGRVISGALVNLQDFVSLLEVLWDFFGTTALPCGVN